MEITSMLAFPTAAAIAVRRPVLAAVIVWLVVFLIAFYVTYAFPQYVYERHCPVV
jgi:hypothetical protein